MSGAAEAATGICRHLRARSAYGRSPDAASWVEGRSAVDATWCLLTMEPAGPDDALAEPTACRRGRRCFVAR